MNKKLNHSCFYSQSIIDHFQKTKHSASRSNLAKSLSDPSENNLNNKDNNNNNNSSDDDDDNSNNGSETAAAAPRSASQKQKRSLRKFQINKIGFVPPCVRSIIARCGTLQSDLASMSLLLLLPLSRLKKEA